MKKSPVTLFLYIILMSLALLLPFSVAGCSGGSDSGAVSYYDAGGGGGTASSSVKGLILSHRGYPIEGARVTVNSSQKDAAAPGIKAGGETYTDSDGLFEIQGLSAGTYYLTAEKTGFDNYSNTVQLSDDAVTFEDITMTWSTPRGIVAGQVTDAATGKPLESVTVTVDSTSANTNTEGRYILSGLTQGTAILTATKTGYETYSDTITIDSGTTALKSFSMKAVSTSGSIAGMVTDQSTGARLQGVTVTAGQSRTTTDMLGCFQLTGIAAGEQIVSATRTGYRAANATVTVTSGKTAVCNMAMAPEGGVTPGAVAGLVTDKDWNVDLEDVIVSIGTLKTSTNDKGLYILNGVPPGTYTITAQKTGYQNYSGTVEVKSGEVTAFPIEMTASTRTGWVYGDVTASDTGEPVRDAKVSIGDHDTLTDEYGFYDLTGIIEGEHEIVVSAAGYEPYQGQVTVPAGSQGVSCPIQLTPKTQIATVYGKVTNTSTGRALRDVLVTIGTSHATTDDRGNYTISGVTEGTCEISAVKNGFDYTPETITVKAPATEKNIEMTPRPTTGEVEGTVTDSWKKGVVPRAIIIAGFEVTLSDSKGRYHLGGLKAGSRKIYAIKHAYWIYYSEVTVEAGKTVTKDIEMTPVTLKGTVAGQVTDKKSGAALERALVFIGCTDCRSDEDGNYSLDVLAGYRLIFAIKHGYDPYVDLIRVTAAETLNHDIEMTPFWDTGQVKGFVTDTDSGAPLENVNVAVGSTSALTDGSGYFELDGIKAGTRTIIASKTGYAAYTGSVVVHADAAATCSFSMTANTPTGTVSGTVTDSGTGKPVGDATVSIEATETDTGSDGRYRLAGIETGSRTIKIIKTGYQTYTAQVTVAAGANSCNAAIAPVSTSGSIEGKVTDAATGKPLQGAEVKGGSSAGTTDESGVYTLAGIQAGDCAVTVSKDGYSSASATITVKAGETVTKDFSLDASQGSGVIEGTVTDSLSGKALKGVLVVARGPGGGEASTDKSGAYRITGLDAGTFSVEATLSGYGTYTTSIAVTSGSTVTLSFTMTALSNKGTLKGTVTDSSTGAPIAGAKITYADRSTETDASGYYELAGVQPGNREFTATKTGYADVNATLKVQPDETVTHDVRMTPQKKGDSLYY
ncbi:MAG: carboxypeptidase regulatory-like domain-containing protein [Candidatus Xenobiia bacterium LiM19]